MNKPKHTNIPKAELERRWTQKVMTLTSSRAKSNAAPAARYGERVAYQSVTSGKMKDSILLRGQDYLGSAVFAGGTNDGTAVLNFLVNPLQGIFAGTRVERMASLYDKFLFKRLRFHTQAAKGTSSDGSYILAYDRDMADTTPIGGESALRNYFAMAGTRSAAIWEDCSIDCPLSDTQDFYYTNYTGYEGRIVAQGQVYVVSQTTPPVGSRLNLWVEYELLLMDPSLEQTSTALSASDSNNGTGRTVAQPTPFIRNSVQTAASGDIRLVPIDQVKGNAALVSSSTAGFQANLPGGWYELIAAYTGSTGGGTPMNFGLLSDAVPAKLRIWDDKNFSQNGITRTGLDYTNVIKTGFNSPINGTSVFRFIINVLDNFVGLVPFISVQNSGTLGPVQFSLNKLAGGKPSSYAIEV